MLFYSMNIAAQNYLERAILETDLSKVEQMLSTRDTLSQEERFICLNLSQQKIQEISDCITFDKINPQLHTFFGAMSVIGIAFLPLAALCYLGDYRYKNDGIAPIAVSIAAITGLVVCFLKAGIDEKKYNEHRDQKHRDAIKIKHLILKS